MKRKSLQIIRGKKSGDQARVRETDLPKIVMQAVGHEAERRRPGFAPGGGDRENFGDVLHKMDDHSLSL